MYAYEQFRNFFAGVADTRREVAKKMLTKGMALTDICDITGFTKSEVEKLKN